MFQKKTVEIFDKFGAINSDRETNIYIYKFDECWFMNVFFGRHSSPERVQRIVQKYKLLAHTHDDLYARVNSTTMRPIRARLIRASSDDTHV